MPILPRVEPTQVQVGVPRGPRENAFTEIGDTLGKAAEAVGAWDKMERETDIANELSHATTDYMLKSDQIGRDLQAEGVNHDNYFPEFQKRHAAVVDEINKSFKYPESRAHFAKGMADNYATTLIKAKDASRKLFISDETAELDTSTQMNAKLYAQNAGDPERQARILSNYQEVLDFKEKLGVIDANKRGDLLTKFRDGANEESANLEINTDAAKFLENLKAGRYDALGEKKKGELGRTANATIRSAIENQKQDIEQKKEAADRNLQKLIDGNASPATIQQFLRDQTEAGIYGNRDREAIDNRLRNGVLNDAPAQADNAQRFLTRFQSGYPTFGSIGQARKEVDAMVKRGEIGDKGAGQIRGHLNQAEHSLRAEQRAEANFENKGKMSDAAAKKLIASNYIAGQPDHPIMPNHKADAQEYTQRVTLGGEDREKVAKEIYARRQQQNEQAKKLQADRAKAAGDDPASKAILDRLNQLKTGRQ